MKQQHADYQVMPYPKYRRWMVAAFRSTHHTPMIHGLIEVDVSRARAHLREQKAKTGESLSFTAFLIACLAQAVEEHKAVQAIRLGSKLLILFEEVDVLTDIERDVAGQKFVVPSIVRAANRKTVREIHQEIRAAQRVDVKSVQKSFPFLFLPVVLFRPFLWAFGWIGRRRPRLWRTIVGTVETSAVGMFGNGTGWGIPPAPATALMLTVGGIGEKPVVVDGQTAVREYLSLTISVNHDLVDGAPAARFTRRLKELIESGYGLDDSTVVPESAGAEGASTPTVEATRPARREDRAQEPSRCFPCPADGARLRATRFEGGIPMSTVDENPAIKTRSGEVRESLASGVVDAFKMKARVNEILNRWPAVGLAVGVVRNGSLEFFHGHGLADIASNTPITEDTVFRVASITKTITAIAVMQLWEQGLIDLDAPANDYLRAYKLIPARAGFRPATVHHLLTHTAGIPEVVYASELLHPGWGPFGARPALHSVEVGEPMPKLSEYYRGGLRLVVESGCAFAYSNHGFATLGQIIEDVSGVPLERYLREHIFEPLGMADSDLARSDRVASRLATGYVLGRSSVRAVPDREWIGAGAGGIYSTPRDMARYVAALLGGGANEHGRVLKPSTMAMMFDPHYQPDSRIPGIGLAFSRTNLGGHLAVEHGGILPGFNSELFAAPDDGVGVMAFTNGSSGAMGWLPLELGQLLRYLLGVPDEIVRSDIPHHPEIWDEICGRYQLPQHISDRRQRVVMGSGAQVFVRGGQLMVRGLSPIPALYRGLPLHPDDETDPYVFRLDTSKFGMPTVCIVFGHEVGVGTTAVHTDLGSQPLSLFKRPATRRSGASLALALGTLAIVSAVRAVRRRSRPYKGV